VRHEVLNAVCYALAIRPVQRESIVNRTWYWEPYKPPAVDPVPTAFAVALSKRYTDVVNSMLDRYPLVFSYTEKGIREEHKLLSVSGWDFNLPLDVAIGLGHTEQAKLLLSHGANVGMCQSLERAAQQGFSEMVDLILEHMPWGLDDRALHRAGRMVQRAAAHQQWRIVRHILDRDSVSVTYSTMRVYLDNVLCSAARYGRNDLVTKMLDLGDRKFSKRAFPLSEAAAGGHLSTCKLLLERNARPEPKEMVGRAEVLARSVARGGSVEVCELLRQHNFWKPWHEIHFLPIAAEYGQLEFAKYAVKHGCDRNRRPRKETSITVLEEDRVLKSPDDIRYFALLRAIVSGHQHIVRWLADEVGIDVGRDSELAHPELFPVNLAIAAGNDGMLALLLQMEANSELEPYTEQCVPCQKRAVETLELYRVALSLREDFKEKWRWIS
jgi:ankyrin repeat protein